MITGAQLRAGRALIRWSAEELANRSKIGVATVRRAELQDGTPGITAANADALQRALETAGVEFIAENGGGAGVRLRKDRPSLDTKIADAKERVSRDVPVKPSPARGMALLKRGAAENDLRGLKAKRAAKRAKEARADEPAEVASDKHDGELPQ